MRKGSYVREKEPRRYYTLEKIINPSFKKEVEKVVEKSSSEDIRILFGYESSNSDPYRSVTYPRASEGKLKFPRGFLEMLNQIKDEGRAKNLLKYATLHEIGHITTGDSGKRVLRGDLSKRAREFKENEEYTNWFKEKYGEYRFTEKNVKRHIESEKLAHLYAITRSIEFFGNPLKGITYGLTLSIFLRGWEELSKEETKTYLRTYYPSLKENLEDRVVKKTKDKFEELEIKEKRKDHKNTSDKMRVKYKKKEDYY